VSKSPRGSSTVSRALICAAALLFLQLGSAFGQEVIQRFDSVVRIAPDGSLTVTETIRVRAEGAEIKRGIYRDFPLTFRDTTGRTREVSFRLLGVMRDGRPEPHFTKRQGSFIRIYAGQEDVLLRRGDYTYTFSYETGRQLRWFDGGAELYWNVTGNEWSFPIYQATVRVELPGSARPARWTAYTGPLGARGTAWRGSVNSGGALVAETTQRLASREGFTIVVELPAEAVQPPSRATQFWYLLFDNRNWIFGGLGLLFVLGYYAFAWRAVGRDPKRGTVIPLFHPPEKVSPALANYVRNWGFSDQWRAFTAAALSLAVRGLLVFDDRDGNLTLRATGRAPNGNLPPAELAILQWVQGRSGSVAISSENGAAVAEIVKQFRSRIEGESKNRFFRRNFGYFLAGAGLTALTIVGIMIFGGLDQEEYFILFAIMFASVWLGAFLIPILHSIFKAASASAIFRVALMFFFVLGVFFFTSAQFLDSLPGTVGGIWSLVGGAVQNHPFPFALATTFAAVNGLFVYLLRAPTDLGRRVMDQLDGLRLYLTTAETPRLNMQAPEISTERFEALLPYAVALDAEEPWSNAFAAAFARAHPGEDFSQHYQPTWRGGSGWSSGDFGRSVSSSVTGASGAFSSAVPSSSGSSGFSSGGGSGGGGGGGGGGGW
jgi:uncharacterized membrane protein YgcG